MVWAQVTARRAELAPLVAVRPDLADRLTAINSAGATNGERIATLNAERRQVLDEIRALPGFADWLGRPSLDALADAVSGGPTVYLNPTDDGCTVIIVRPGLELEVATLSGCDRATITDRTEEFLGAVRVLPHLRAPLMADQAAGRTSRKATRVAYRTALDAVRGTLEWGWTAIAEPVLTMALGDATPNRP